MAKCEFCAEKPCKEACPCDCSPADFMMAARRGEPRDYCRAAALILANNPLGGVCGTVCPDRFCMKACVRARLGTPVNISAVQAAIIQKAYAVVSVAASTSSAVEQHGIASRLLFNVPAPNGKKVAIAGAGPAGLGTAAVLAQLGYTVDVFESRQKPGGMTNLIPRSRLADRVVHNDIEFIRSLGNVNFKKGKIIDLQSLVAERPQPPGISGRGVSLSLRERGRGAALRGTKGYDAIVIATGLDIAFKPGIKGEETAVAWTDFLSSPWKFNLEGRRVGIIGGGAVAVDCAITAKKKGAAHVELFALERLSEMPLTAAEFKALVDFEIHISGRTSVVSILKKSPSFSKGGRRKSTTSGRCAGLKVCKVTLKKGMKFHPRNVIELPETQQLRRDINFVIVAIGAHGSVKIRKQKGVFYTGDLVNGPTTVVEAVAAGKNTAMLVDSFVRNKSRSGGEATLVEFPHPPRPPKGTKSSVTLAGKRMLPVPIDADFFGRRISSPFLLSAAPPTDGYDQMRKAYEAGWAGGVMKTAFDNVPIHIPSEYMFALTPSTYGNCDNVSGHPLDRVCREVERLVKEFPDRLTMASTGGPVTGNDEADMRVWQSNTKKLESAGAMGIEYSLSCPQGGDGTKGDIVSQNPELTAKIVSWVMEVSSANVPKLFKLTAAVTSIFPIITAIKEVFARYPTKKAGVTLANTFPALAFRNEKARTPQSEVRSSGFKVRSSEFPRSAPDSPLPWEKGIVIGMSGEGVLPISYLTLANVSRMGVVVSGNGGVMDYKGAADFLALGAKTVQFCTIVMKYGYGIIEELNSGLSWLMKERNFASVDKLIGCALPQPIVPFTELPSLKKISAVDKNLCVHCGNCSRCSYMAITLGRKKVPETDPAKCIGCSICVQKCPAGALYMRDRTPDEIALLSER